MISIFQTTTLLQIYWNYWQETDLSGQQRGRGQAIKDVH
jgi:hypothetical protein